MRRAALRRAAGRADAGGLHRGRAGRRAWARATCWWATTSASAPSAPATTPCSTRPATRHGFDVARMNSYEVHGLRVSSSAVREALAEGRMARCAARCSGRPYAISGHVVHGRKLGRALGASAPGATRLPHAQPALHALEAGGQRHLRGAGARPGATAAAGRGQPGRAPFARRRTTSTAAACCWRPIACDWPADLGAEGAYGKIIRVELLHKLHDELRYDQPGSPDRGHRQGLRRDARAFFASTHAETHRQTTRDRI